jgi:hypothetical protein
MKLRSIVRSLIILLTIHLLTGSVVWGASSSTVHPAASLDGVRLPFEGGPFRIVQGPSCPEYSHTNVPEAIDFVMPEGTHLVAVQSGEVTFVGSNGNYGNQVRVTHANGLTSWYSHIQDGGFRVAVGDRVNQGQTVALSGNTGLSTGPHLHFEIRSDRWTLVPIDSLPGISWNAERGGRCTGSATGGPVESSDNGNFSLLSLQPDHLEIFRRESNGESSHRWWDGGSNWHPIWGQLGIKIWGTPSVVSWDPDRQDIFVRGEDNHIYHQTWTRNNDRTAWKSLGGTTYDDITALSLQPGHLEVFHRGTGGDLYHRWSDDAGATWSTWANLGIKMRGTPAVVSWGPDRQDIFVRGENDAMYHQTWTRTAGRSEWKSLGGQTKFAPKALSWGEGRLDVFHIGLDGAFYHMWWEGEHRSAWKKVGEYQYITPQVSVTPSSGSRGTLFHQPGTGFSPNNPATLEFTYPNGDIQTKEIRVGADGSYVNDYIMPDNAQIGTYSYRALDHKGVRWSNRVTFTVVSEPPDPTNQPPNRPTLLTPPNGSTTDTATPTFTWNDTGDPDNGPQATRSFWVTLRSLDGTQVAESGWISDTRWTAPTLADGTYQWRVKASDGAAESAWTGNWNLTIKTSENPPKPYFRSNYTLGGPGSTFVFTAGHFPAGAEATMSIREPGMSDFRTVTRLPVPDSGTLVFVLSIPTSAAPGEYIVQIAVDGQNLLASAETQASLRLEQSLTIAAEEPPHTDPPPDGVPVIVPPESGTPNIYLPLVVR